MIEAVSSSNLKELLPLIRAYQEFYKVEDISDERNEAFFSRFGEGSPAGCQFLYRDSGEVVGFASVFFSYASSITSKVAILNDLYSLPDRRGKGVGRSLIEHCYEYAVKSGAARLQWVTAPDNDQAQRLYDSMKAERSSIPIKVKLLSLRSAPLIAARRDSLPLVNSSLNNGIHSP